MTVSRPAGTCVVAADRSHRSVRAVRIYVVGGVALGMITLCLPAARSLLTGHWPVPGRAGLAAVLVTAVAVHLVTAGQLVAAAVVQWSLPTALAAAAAGVAWVAVTHTTPAEQLAWTAVLGVTSSAWLMARQWRCAAVVTVLAVATTLGLASALHAADGSALTSDPGASALLAAGVFLLPGAVDAGQLWCWRVVQQLEATRELVTDLAVARERARIAAELHDIQGHTLNVIALHAELVERLIATQPAEAEQHARTVRTLAADALHETRSLVHGYRAGDLLAEVGNAAEVLRAAGAEVDVRTGSTALPEDAAAVFAPLVREAVTNILRHAAPRQVGITVGRERGELRLTVVNDGVSVPGARCTGPDGMGLVGLQERFARLGGRVEYGERDGRWSLAGAVPEKG